MQPVCFSITNLLVSIRTYFPLELGTDRFAFDNANDFWYLFDFAYAAKSIGYLQSKRTDN